MTYHPQSQKRKEKGGSAFYVGSQKKSVTSYQQTISIRNTRLTSLPTLLVREQVYVSQDERIKVDILEPNELRAESTQKGTNAPVNKARWVQNDDDGAAIDRTGVKTNDGIFEWVCKDVGAGAKLDLNVAWDVIVPIGLDWQWN